MIKEKKQYVSPSIESEQVDLPGAWACTTGGNSADGYCWEGSFSSLVGTFG